MNKSQKLMDNLNDSQKPRTEAETQRRKQLIDHDFNEPLRADANAAHARLAAKRAALEEQRRRQQEADENAPVIKYSDEDRDRVVMERNVGPRTKFDPSRLRVKKRVETWEPGEKKYHEKGKTRRDKMKTKDDSRKTNNPAISQSMKGKTGQKPAKGKAA